VSEMTEFQEFFFHHSDKNVPTPEEARRQFVEEFAELVEKKSVWIDLLLSEGKSFEEIAAHHEQNPHLSGDLVGFYLDSGDLFSILEEAGELNKGSKGYILYQEFLEELTFIRLANTLGIQLD
jgi:hypothetical protein